MMTEIIVSTAAGHLSLGPKLVLDQSISFSNCLQSSDLRGGMGRNCSCDFRFRDRGDGVGELCEGGMGEGGPVAVMTQYIVDEVDCRGVMGVLMHVKVVRICERVNLKGVAVEMVIHSMN